MSAAALDHPYICKVFEIGEHDDAMFLVMECIAGETIHRRLQAGRMPLDLVLRVAGEIAEALQEAHSRGLLHRDLKPANIMLTSQGHVKIMDFGLAKRLVGPLSASDATVEMEPQLTAPGTILGTPDYMSPEQVKCQTLDNRSDLFSFGVILAEMAGGSHPFQKPSVAETFSAVLREPPELGDGIPPGLGVVLGRLLAKAPGDRYASAAEVRADLERLPAVAEPARAPKPAARVSWRWPALAALLIIAALAAYVAVHAGLWRALAPGGAAAIRSIAVLPLDNYSGDPAQDYFAEGMTDELTADLANISQLRVISRGSVMQFKGKQRPPTPEIARILNVDAVVEGSVVRSGHKVRINAQLIDARADKHLWAKSFEGNSQDVLALQDELASAIAREIRVQLTPAEQSRLSRATSVNPDGVRRVFAGPLFLQPAQRRESAEGHCPVRRGGPAESRLCSRVLGTLGRLPLGRLQRRCADFDGSQAQGQSGCGESHPTGRQFGGRSHVPGDFQALLRIRLGRLRDRVSPARSRSIRTTPSPTTSSGWRWLLWAGSTRESPRAHAPPSSIRSPRKLRWMRSSPTPGGATSRGEKAGQKGHGARSDLLQCSVRIRLDRHPGGQDRRRGSGIREGQDDGSPLVRLGVARVRLWDFRRSHARAGGARGTEEEIPARVRSGLQFRDRLSGYRRPGPRSGLPRARLRHGFAMVGLAEERSHFRPTPVGAAFRRAIEEGATPAVNDSGS